MWHGTTIAAPLLPTHGTPRRTPAGSQARRLVASRSVSVASIVSDAHARMLLPCYQVLTGTGRNRSEALTVVQPCHVGAFRASQRPCQCHEFCAEYLELVYADPSLLSAARTRHNVGSSVPQAVQFEGTLAPPYLRAWRVHLWAAELRRQNLIDLRAAGFCFIPPRVGIFEYYFS